jgi:hypothetical protein
MTKEQVMALNGALWQFFDVQGIGISDDVLDAAVSAVVGAVEGEDEGD